MSSGQWYALYGAHNFTSDRFFYSILQILLDWGPVKNPKFL